MPRLGFVELLVSWLQRLQSNWMIKLTPIMFDIILRCQYPSKSDPPDNASRASDMFSLGVIVYMLVSGGSEPFWKGSDVQAIKNTIKRDVEFPSTDFRKVSDEAKQFIRGQNRFLYCEQNTYFLQTYYTRGPETGCQPHRHLRANG